MLNRLRDEANRWNVRDIEDYCLNSISHRSFQWYQNLVRDAREVDRFDPILPDASDIFSHRVVDSDVITRINQDIPLRNSIVDTIMDGVLDTNYIQLTKIINYVDPEIYSQLSVVAANYPLNSSCEDFLPFMNIWILAFSGLMEHSEVFYAIKHCVSNYEYVPIDQNQV